MILTNRKIIAGWCFTLSFLVVVCLISYFYADNKYPTSSRLLELNLTSPSVVDQFKVEEAKKAGYSEKEIAEYLAKTNWLKFRVFMRTVLLTEVAVFLVVLLVGVGLMVLKIGKKQTEAREQSRLSVG
jgi:hypothetical protein